MAQMLTALVATAAWLAGSVAQAPQHAAGTPTEADYVVVGGGTAGCALAARLCEGLPGATVVLLERSAPRTQAQARTMPLPAAVPLEEASTTAAEAIG